MKYFKYDNNCGESQSMTFDVFQKNVDLSCDERKIKDQREW